MNAIPIPLDNSDQPPELLCGEIKFIANTIVNMSQFLQLDLD